MPNTTITSLRALSKQVVTSRICHSKLRGSHAPLPYAILLYREVCKHASRSIEAVAQSANIRLQHHINEYKLLALRAYSEHIGINGVGAYVLRIKVAIGIIHHVTQLLSGTPALSGFVKIPQAVVLYDLVVFDNIYHGLAVHGYSRNIREG